MISLPISGPDLDIYQYERVLSAEGVLFLELQFADKEANIFKRIVGQLGQADVHDSLGTTLWDVKYDAGADQANAARSLTTNEFPMHTDASFEDLPPKYIGLYVIQEDTLGGGVSQFIDSRKVLAAMSMKSRRTLRHTQFKIRVPQEFMQDKAFIMGSIVDKQGNFRFRKEIIALEECNEAQLEAISELETLLQDESMIESRFLKTGTIMLLDNRRFLHARTEVKDKNRHLLRMRFNPKSEIGVVVAA